MRLRIYNTLGQVVRTLVHEVQPAGRYQVVWDSRDERGVAVASGVYLARLIYPGGVQTRAVAAGQVAPTGWAGSVSLRTRLETPDKP